MNELTSNAREEISLLGARFDRLEFEFERRLGISLNNETGMNIVPLKNKTITISLLSEIENSKDYYTALETLNQAGNAHGVEFQKEI